MGTSAALHKQLWAAAAAEPWQRARAGAAATLASHSSDKLQQLNSWYEQQLPVAIAGRAPRQHMTQPELAQLVDWKLTHGKWRPRLLDYAKAATEEQVQEASAEAFAALLAGAAAGGGDAAKAEVTVAASGKRASRAAADAPAAKKQKQRSGSTDARGASDHAAAAPAAPAAPAPAPAGAAAAEHGVAAPPAMHAVRAALDALTVLKGVGPATASAALAAADASGGTPFMGDAALEAATGGRDYTAKAYLQLVGLLRDKAAWLQEQDPGAGWTALLVERCLHAAALSGTPAKKGASAGKTAAQSKRKR